MLHKLEQGKGVNLKPTNHQPKEQQLISIPLQLIVHVQMTLTNK